MTILVTGCAGFIGYHVSKRLIEESHKVIGIDNMNNYGSYELKRIRINKLNRYGSFTSYIIDINDARTIEDELLSANITHVIHLAAQAGVRESISKPFLYTHSNINGLVTILELCKKIKTLEHVIFASSSSVYGNNSGELPFIEDQMSNQPTSLYAASKIAGESICHSYSSMFNMPITALRFFTVYGPWGRPDMAIYKFTKAIADHTPVTLYNKGEMRRDFTYIDDVIKGITAAMKHKNILFKQQVPFKVYNIGKGEHINLNHCLSLIEKEYYRLAIIIPGVMQKGDVENTLADINLASRDLDFRAEINIHQGIQKFVYWYKEFTKIKCQFPF